MSQRLRCYDGGVKIQIDSELPLSPLETRFEQLRSLNQIRALLGQTEDLHLDCKEWPARDDDLQRILAKSLSGFSNADGGILVIGVEAKSINKGDPDVIQSLKPVADAIGVKSKIENLIGNLVEPLLPGIRVAEVLEVAGQPSGFVLVYIPPTDGLPVRSRKNRDFYMRVSAGTFPMEYFQLADTFGRRQRPVLSLWTAMGTIKSENGGAFYERGFFVGIMNSGRGIARFPSLRYAVTPGINFAPYGLDGNGHWGLPLRPTTEGRVLFGGGADDVIHPGTHLEIVKLTQRSRVAQWQRPGAKIPAQYFPEFEFQCGLAADGVPYETVSYTLQEGDPLGLA
jgi:hypothetical protein